MDILQSRVVSLHYSSQVETRFAFLGDCWKEERFHRDRLREDRGRLSLADVLAAIADRRMQRDEARRIDPKGAAALTPEDQLLPSAFSVKWGGHLASGVSSHQTRTYLKRLEQAQRVQGSEGPVQHPDRTYRLFPGV